MTIREHFDRKDLQQVLSKVGIAGERDFSPSRAGISASVFFVHVDKALRPSSDTAYEFVLKIWPDTPDKEKAIEMNDRIHLTEQVRRQQESCGAKEFTLPEMIANPDGGYLFDLTVERPVAEGGRSEARQEPRSAVISKFVKGKVPNLKDPAQAGRIGVALAAFHMARRPHRIDDQKTDQMQELAEFLIEKINERFSSELKKAMEESSVEEIRRRKEMMTLVADSVGRNKDKIKENVKGIPLLEGMTHGDFHYENVILTPKDGVTIIDLDSASSKGRQIHDISFFFTRHAFSDHEDSYKAFRDSYFKRRGLDESHIPAFDKGVKTLCALNSFDSSVFHHLRPLVQGIVTMEDFFNEQKEMMDAHDKNMAYLLSPECVATKAELRSTGKGEEKKPMPLRRSQRSLKRSFEDAAKRPDESPSAKRQASFRR